MMRELIRKILNEEVAEPKKNSVKDSLQQMVDKIGVIATAEFVGGIDNLVKLRYGGNFKSFYDENNFSPYKYNLTGTDMYIDDAMIQYIGSPLHYTKKEKSLGNFSYGSKNGIKYKFDARVDGPRMGSDGQLWWRVVGTSGDSGFGYGYISQKNTLGKRYRQQIFQQIIDKYNLNEYM